LFWQAGQKTNQPTQAKEETGLDVVLPLRNVTLTSPSGSFRYTVYLPRDPDAFLEGRQEDLEVQKGYKMLTCFLHRDRGHNLILIGLGASFVYFSLVLFVIPRVPFRENWRI